MFVLFVLALFPVSCMGRAIFVLECSSSVEVKNLVLFSGQNLVLFSFCISTSTNVEEGTILPHPPPYTSDVSHSSSIPATMHYCKLKKLV